MKLSKQHFELIADIIGHHLRNHSITDQELTDICNEVENYNPNFNREKFKEACKTAEIIDTRSLVRLNSLILNTR